MEFAQVRNYHVLYSCLNWGMGHVSRSLGIIDRLILQGNTIIFAGSQAQIDIVKGYYPNLECVVFPEYPFKFKGKGRFKWDLFKSSTSLYRFVKKESQLVKELVDDHTIDVVISDNRYGFRDDTCESIFVTHQLNLPVNYWQIAIQRMHQRYIKKFNKVWVLDNSDSFYAGKLSVNRSGFDVEYIGIVSRFSRYKYNEFKSIPVVLVANGPDVYAIKFIEAYLERQTESPTIIASPQVLEQLNYHGAIASTNWIECDQVILKAEKIVAYFGYSTLMDIQYLKCDYDLFPTPGQDEQKYLAKIHQA